MGLIHLIYASTRDIHFSEADMLGLMPPIRQKNSTKHITGILLHIDKNFIQVLEGEESEVHDLFARIKKDKRHHHVTTIIDEPIFERNFFEWSMGFVSLTEQQVVAIPGMNDYFTGTQLLDSLSPGRVKKILKAFSNGAWQNL